jgi:hypothetical protein
MPYPIRAWRSEPRANCRSHAKLPRFSGQQDAGKFHNRRPAGPPIWVNSAANCADNAEDAVHSDGGGPIIGGGGTAPDTLTEGGQDLADTTMTITRRWQLACAAGFGLGLAATTGCQTHIISNGMTLPSSHYLEHPPQYFPPDPDYPLQREVNSQLNQAAAAQAANPAIAGPVAAPALPAPPVANPPPPTPAGR